MRRALFIVLLLLMILTLALAACGGEEEPETAAPTQPPEATEAPAATEVPAGDPEKGREVFLGKGGCGACHTIEGVEGAMGMVGPNLTHIATRAAETAKEAGVSSAEEYIRQSILEPNAYVAKECPTGPCVAGTMPQTFKDQLSEEEINDLVAFLMQQK